MPASLTLPPVDFDATDNVAVEQADLARVNEWIVVPTYLKDRMLGNLDIPSLFELAKALGEGRQNPTGLGSEEMVVSSTRFQPFIDALGAGDFPGAATLARGMFGEGTSRTREAKDIGSEAFAGAAQTKRRQEEALSRAEVFVVDHYNDFFASIAGEGDVTEAQGNLWRRFIVDYDATRAAAINEGLIAEDSTELFPLSDRDLAALQAFVKERPQAAPLLADAGIDLVGQGREQL